MFDPRDPAQRVMAFIRDRAGVPLSRQQEQVYRDALTACQQDITGDCPKVEEDACHAACPFRWMEA